MKGKVKYMYPYNALTYRPSITVSSTIEVSGSPWRQQSSSGTYSVSPTLSSGKWADVVDSVDFDFSLSSNNPAKSGLVLEYLFYEGSGTTLHDTSGNGNNGTIYGATWKQLSNGKWALYFDTNYVEVGYSNIFAIHTWTLEVLAQPIESVLTNGIFGTRFGSDITFDVKFQYTQGLHGDVGNGSEWLSTAVNYFPGIKLGNWYHIVYAVQTNKTEIYLNGKLGTTITYNGTPLLMKSNQNMRIGVSCDSEYGKKEIALVRIFNYALSSSEVKTLYNMAKPLIPG